MLVESRYWALSLVRPPTQQYRVEVLHRHAGSATHKHAHLELASALVLSSNSAPSEPGMGMDPKGRRGDSWDVRPRNRTHRLEGYQIWPISSHGLAPGVHNGLAEYHTFATQYFLYDNL